MERISSNEMNVESSTFCPLPWTGFSMDPDGKPRPCCIHRSTIKDGTEQDFFAQKHTVQEIFHSPFMNQLREDLNNGIRNKNCSDCWANEKNNYESKRLKEKEVFLARQSLEGAHLFGSTTELQVVLNNTCNLKCRSCTPVNSSKMAAEAKGDPSYDTRDFPHGFLSDPESMFWRTRKDWFKTMRTLEIMGGEPFLQKEVKFVIDELIADNLSKKIDLRISTNGTIFDKKFFEKLIYNFHGLGLGLSIDGIFEKYDYIRSGGSWKETHQNISEFYKYHTATSRDYGFSLGINHTVSWFNIYYLPEFHQWFKVHFPKLNIWNNFVRYPAHSAVYMIPDAFKSEVERKLKAYDFESYTPDIQGIISHMNSQSVAQAELEHTWSYHKKLDYARREKFSDYFPELSAYGIMK